MASAPAGLGRDEDAGRLHSTKKGNFHEIFNLTENERPLAGVCAEPGPAGEAGGGLPPRVQTPGPQGEEQERGSLGSKQPHPTGLALLAAPGTGRQRPEVQPRPHRPCRLTQRPDPCSPPMVSHKPLTGWALGGLGSSRVWHQWCDPARERGPGRVSALTSWTLVLLTLTMKLGL